MTRLIHYLTLFLLPLYLVKIPLGNECSFNVLDIFLVSSLVLQLLYLKNTFTKKEFLSVLKENSVVLVLLFLLLSGFTLAYFLNISPENWTDGVGVLKSFLLLPLVFSLGVFLLAKKGLLKNDFLLGSFFASAVLQSLLGYFFAIQGIFTYDKRLTIFYESPNQFAMILAPAIIIGVYFLTKEPRQQNLYIPSTFQKFFIALGIISLFFSLFLTRSAGAFFGLILGLFSYFFFINNLFRKKLCFFIFSLIILSLVLAINMSAILNILEYQPATEKNSLDSRIAIYQVSRKLLRDNWLVGIGPGNFQSSYLKSQDFFEPFPQWAVPHAHNNLLHLFVEGGIISLTSFIVLIFLLFFKKTQEKGSLLVFLILSIYLLVHGTVDTTIWKNDIAILWWLGFVFSLTQKKSLHRK